MNKVRLHYLQISQARQGQVQEEGDRQEEEAEDAANGVGQPEGLVEAPEVSCGAATAVDWSKVGGKRGQSGIA